MIEINKGKCCGMIGLLHGNNSNGKEIMSDSFREGVVLIDTTLMPPLCFAKVIIFQTKLCQRLKCFAAK